MTEIDIEQLQKFGKKVQTKHITRNETKRFEIVLVHSKKYFFRLFKIVSEIMKQGTKAFKINIFHIKYRYRIKQGRRLFFLKKINKNKQKNCCTTVIEHQKQWNNISIIIRHRKKVKDRPIEKMMQTYQYPSSYYFHTIQYNGLKKTKFNPRNSIWDFRYPCDGSVFSKIKTLFN